jgi:putative membrane protein
MTSPPGPGIDLKRPFVISLETRQFKRTTINNMIIRLLVRILANSLAIYLAAYFVEGFNFPHDWKLLLFAGFILALLNGLLKPVLKFLSMPLIFLTLGVFPLVINIGILWLLQYFIPDLKIEGFWAYFWSIIIIGATNWLFNVIVKHKPLSEIIEV